MVWLTFRIPPAGLHDVLFPDTFSRTWVSAIYLHSSRSGAVLVSGATRACQHVTATAGWISLPSPAFDGGFLQHRHGRRDFHRYVRYVRTCTEGEARCVSGYRRPFREFTCTENFLAMSLRVGLFMNDILRYRLVANGAR